MTHINLKGNEGTMGKQEKGGMNQDSSAEQVGNIGDALTVTLTFRLAGKEGILRSRNPASANT